MDITLKHVGFLKCKPLLSPKYVPGVATMMDNHNYEVIIKDRILINTQKIERARAQHNCLSSDDAFLLDIRIRQFSSHRGPASINQLLAQSKASQDPRQ